MTDQVYPPSPQVVANANVKPEQVTFVDKLQDPQW